MNIITSKGKHFKIKEMEENFFVFYSSFYYFIDTRKNFFCAS